MQVPPTTNSMSPPRKRPRIFQSLSSQLSSFRKKTPLLPSPPSGAAEPCPMPETLQIPLVQDQEQSIEVQDEVEVLKHENIEGRNGYGHENGTSHATDATDAIDMNDTTDAINATGAMDVTDAMDVMDAINAMDAMGVMDMTDAINATDATNAINVTEAEAQLLNNSAGSIREPEKPSGAWPGTFAHPPTIGEVTSALEDIKNILKPPQKTGQGYKDPELDLLF
jgi:hypothetical protein